MIRIGSIHWKTKQPTNHYATGTPSPSHSLFLYLFLYFYNSVTNFFSLLFVSNSQSFSLFHLPLFLRTSSSAFTILFFSLYFSRLTTPYLLKYFSYLNPAFSFTFLFFSPTLFFLSLSLSLSAAAAVYLFWTFTIYLYNFFS